MAPDDFDTDALSKYLHITPTQVMKMAERGRLPGRKIGGEWRFSQAEIHHWLEDQIGVSDEEELVQMEEVLQKGDPGPTHSLDIRIVDLLRPEAVAIPLNARTRSSVITQMVKVAAETGLLWDAPKMEEAVRARESLHPTALDNGVALLHPRRPMATILAEGFLCLGRTWQGIPFGGSRGALTDIFFLICSTDDALHLRVLTRLSRLISDPDLLNALREAEATSEAIQAIRTAEQNIPD